MTVRSTLLLLACALAPAIVAYRTAASAENPPPPRTGPVLWAEPERDSAKLDRPPDLRAVATKPGGVALAVGSSIGNGAGNRAWRTEDGGRTWTALPSPAPYVSSAGMREDGLTLVSTDRGRILRSLAGGADWTEVRPPADWRTEARPAGGWDIFRLAFVGERTVFGAGGALLRSDDSGETWTKLDVPEQRWYDVAFVDEQHAWLVGGGGLVLWTDDGGDTWSSRRIATDQTLRSVHAFDAAHALVAGSGGVMFRTRDQGRTWAEIDNGTGHHLRRVAFLDALHGVAVGFWGTVLRTDDGGETWQEENSGTLAHLYDVAWTAGGVPIAVGLSETILLGGAR
jgi:photosystem II stability/assembly factor-like uncharacterized protein